LSKNEVEAAVKEAAKQELQQVEDVDGESSDSDSDEDSSSDTSESSDSSDSSGSSGSSTLESRDSEEEEPELLPEEQPELLPEEEPSNGEECAKEPSREQGGLAVLQSQDDILLDCKRTQAPELEEVPELSATTLWRNKILGREAPVQQMAKSKALNSTMPRHEHHDLPLSSVSPPRPSPKRTLELSGIDALVSLRLSAKELAREKLKMLQQCRAESKGTGLSNSLPQLIEAKMTRIPESQVWEVSHVPQASHFTKVGKTRMPKQAQQSKGSKNNQVKASMTQSRSLPSISVTPSQFGIAAGAQRHALQARLPPQQRSMDVRS